MNKIKRATCNLKNRASLDKKIVGIDLKKIASSKGKDIENRFSFFIRKALKSGGSFHLNSGDLSRFASKVYLGFEEPKYTDLTPRVRPAETEEISVAPLSNLEEPDIAVLISFPEELMRVLQTLYKETGSPLRSYSTSEGSAPARELVAFPYMESKPNISLLCNGARTEVGYE
ncbi:hypothetical protein C9439_03540, partial [archaeon SCG-AAA382B04]